MTSPVHVSQVLEDRSDTLQLLRGADDAGESRRRNFWPLMWLPPQAKGRDPGPGGHRSFSRRCWCGTTLWCTGRRHRRRGRPSGFFSFLAPREQVCRPAPRRQNRSQSPASGPSMRRRAEPPS